MELKTTLHIKPSTEKIHPHYKITSIGSCFADHIGNRFKEMKMDILGNPFGVIYNPISQMKLIQLSLNNDSFNADHIVENHDIYNHLDAHSQFGRKDLSKLREGLNDAAEQFKTYLKEAKILIITFGTAWVYRYEKTKQIVANCHKLPSQNFTKELLSIEDICSKTEETIKLIQQFNPDIKVILTVSPVRHTKEGIQENMLSKSILRVAVDSIQQDVENIHYFPAYELMMDDLRDYRFYAEDMIHPNNTAQNYVWQKFRETYFSEPLFTYCDKWQSIKNDLDHRVMNPGSQEHIQFLESLLKKLNKFSVIGNVDDEKAHVQEALEHAKEQ